MMRVPIVKRVTGAPPPERLFRDLAGERWTLWLDSGLPSSSRNAGLSFLACDPFRVLRGRDGRSEWVDPEGIHEGGEPLDELARALRQYAVRPGEDVPPFCGGAAGFFGYELARDTERVPLSACHDLDLPDLEVALYDLVVGWDGAGGECWIASTGFPERGAAGRARARTRLQQAEDWLSGGSPPRLDGLPRLSGPSGTVSAPPVTYPVSAGGIRSTFTGPAYARAVRQAIELILAGDVFQVNLSQRFEAPAPGEPDAAYLRLREASPAPFGAFFRSGDAVVLSNSPERFVRVDRNGLVQTRPIKGTRPRHRDPRRDRALAAELAASVKDRAENLMIVDLLRNDISRVCEPGHVRAVDLFRVESYATVHHLVSTIEGRLRKDRGRVDLLRAAFPSGSVTGAPKLRAMEIIAELEPVARGPYCGAIGYLGFAGDMDTSVSIRIAVSVGGRMVFHAGGAVVADSDPKAEYEETLFKARALLDVAGGGPP